MFQHKVVGFFIAGTLVAALTISLVAPAVATTVAPLTLVSGPSPFANCSIGGDGPGVINYPNAEVEPFVVVNPANSQNILGAWQQDRWNDGGAHGLVAGFSLDGVNTWGETPLPFSECAGPNAAPYERASDPGVSFGPDGKAYAISISFDKTTFRNSVAAATSSDGGKTWGNLILLIQDVSNPNTGNPFNDKELIFADPTHKGFAYAVWDRLEDVYGTKRNREPIIRVKHNKPAPQPIGFTGPAYLARTTNGGKSWQPAKVIVQTGVNEQTIANYIVINPRTGTLFDFFTYFTADGFPHLGFVRSDNQGATWTKPHIFADLLTVGVPNTRTGDIIPIPAIDPPCGVLYVVWQDSRFNGGQNDETVLSRSTDEGQTWSAPVRVNDSTGQPAFTGTVTVNSQGQLAVTYYQFVSGYLTDYRLKTSADGGATFSVAISLLATPFDMSTAPDAGGFFVGDYEGLTSVSTNFVPFFVQTNSGNTSNRTDVFATNVAP